MTAPLMTFRVLDLPLTPSQLTAERLAEEIECLTDIVSTASDGVLARAKRDLAACLAERETRTDDARLSALHLNGMI